MKSLKRLDFAPREGAPRWLLPVLLVSAAVVAGIAWRMSLSGIGSDSSAGRVVEATPPAALRAIEPGAANESVRAMLLERNRPWPLVLTALEAVEVPSVTVESLEIGQGQPLAIVEVRGESSARLLEFAESLNAGTPHETGALRWRMRTVRAAADGGATARLEAAVIESAEVSPGR